MTRENATKWLKDMLKNMDLPQEQYQIALEMAIKALEQEPKTNNDLDMKLKLMEANVNGYTQGLKDAIDDIKTEISMYENHDESADEMVQGIKSILSLISNKNKRVAIPSAEPCVDCISRAELLKAIDTWDKFGLDDTNHLFRLDNLSLPHYVPYIHYDDVVKCIKGMPSVQPKTNRANETSTYYSAYSYVFDD